MKSVLTCCQDIAGKVFKCNTCADAKASYFRACAKCVRNWSGYHAGICFKPGDDGTSHKMELQTEFDEFEKVDAPESAPASPRSHSRSGGEEESEAAESDRSSVASTRDEDVTEDVTRNSDDSG